MPGVNYIARPIGNNWNLISKILNRLKIREHSQMLKFSIYALFIVTFTSWLGLLLFAYYTAQLFNGTDWRLTEAGGCTVICVKVQVHSWPCNTAKLLWTSKGGNQRCIATWGRPSLFSDLTRLPSPNHSAPAYTEFQQNRAKHGWLIGDQANFPGRIFHGP